MHVYIINIKNSEKHANQLQTLCFTQVITKIKFEFAK